MSTTETTGQLLNRRDAITSRIATYRQPGQPIRPKDREELEEVMAELHRRETEADIDPGLYGLPQDSEIKAPAGWDVAEPGPEQAKTARETLSDFRTFAHSTYGPNRDGWPRVTRQIEDQLVGKAFDELDPLREARP